MASLSGGNARQVKTILLGWPGVEPTLGGSGESRPLPKSVILSGFFAPSFPTDTVASRPLPTTPLENVRKIRSVGRLYSCAGSIRGNPRAKSNARTTSAAAREKRKGSRSDPPTPTTARWRGVSRSKACATSILTQQKLELFAYYDQGSRLIFVDSEASVLRWCH